MKRFIHIWDLPAEKIYIQFNDKFREKFFDCAYEKFGNWKLLGKNIGIKRADTSIARNWRSGNNCYPLSKIFKISEITGISKKNVETNIAEIKYKTLLNKRGGSSGKSINNPKFPIKINGDFIEILGHICGDGTICGGLKKGIKTVYVNNEKKLITNFIKLVQDNMGDIEPSIEIRDDHKKYKKPCYFISYPSIISCILLSVFEYRIGTDIEIPNYIFKMNKNTRCRFIRALFDDEGHVSDKHKFIRIGMKPLIFVNSLNELLDSIGIKTSGVKTERGMNYLKLCDGKNITLFYQKINFKHPTKKIKLENLINKGWKFERFHNGVARERIIELLNLDNNLNANELASILDRNPQTIKGHLRNIKNDI